MAALPNAVVPLGEKPVKAPRGAATASSIRRNFSWILAGNLVYAGSQAGMLVVLSKLGSPEMVGQFALGLAVCAPLFLFSNLQLSAIQATDARRQFAFADYLGLRMAATLLALLVALSTTMVAGYTLHTTLVVLAIAATKAVEALSDVYYGMRQQMEQMHRVAISLILRGIGSLVAVGAGVLLTGNVFWGTILMGSWWLLVLLCFDARVDRSSVSPAPSPARGEMDISLWRPRWNVATVRALLALSLPLGLVSAVDSLNSNIPRYFIQHHSGEGALGFFSALAYLMVAGATVVNALAHSSRPRLARLFIEDRSAFVRLTCKLLFVGLAAGAVGVVLALVGGKPLLSLLYTPEYAAYSSEFAWIMVAAMLWYAAGMAGTAITAARRFHVQMPVYVVSALITGLSSWFMVPRLGVEGAALALTSGMGGRLLLNLLILGRLVLSSHSISASSEVKLHGIS